MPRGMDSRHDPRRKVGKADNAAFITANSQWNLHGENWADDNYGRTQETTRRSPDKIRFESLG